MIKADINLNSREWCDLIFEGKNKNYGAYVIRNESSTRHLKAFLIVGALGLSLAFGVTFREKYGLRGSEAEEMDGSVKITKIDLEPKMEIEKPKEVLPPVEKLVAKSIAYTPPEVVSDTEATEPALTQDALTLDKNAIIAGVTSDGVTDGSTREILGDDEIVGEPTGDPAGKGKVHEHVEQMPAYPGGSGELMAYLSKNIKYPVIAQEQLIQGAVVLRFIVDTDGSITNVEVIKGIDPSCDKEAKRVVSTMPKWIPGKQNGRAVKVFFTVPVRFRLAG